MLSDLRQWLHDTRRGRRPFLALCSAFSRCCVIQRNVIGLSPVHCWWLTNRRNIPTATNSATNNESPRDREKVVG
jgi:hypothetical protein